jgi:hypothetical protein
MNYVKIVMNSLLKLDDLLYRQQSDQKFPSLVLFLSFPLPNEQKIRYTFPALSLRSINLCGQIICQCC